MELSSRHVTELGVALLFGAALSTVLLARPARPWLPVLVAVAGAVALAVGTPGLTELSADSPSVGLALAALAALPLTERFGRDTPPRTASAVVILALGGLFATVPDTEVPLRVAGAMVPALAVGIVVSERAPLRWWGLVTAPVLMAVSLSVADRSAAAIAAVGCLGVMLAEPIASMTVRPRSWVADDPRTIALCLGLQLGIVAVCSRAVPARSPSTALLLVSAVLATSAVAIRVRLTQVGPSPWHQAPPR